MANTNDNSGKGPQKPGPDGNPRRPIPIIDVKPTKVGIKDVAPAQPAGAASSAGTKPTEAGAASKAHEAKQRTAGSSGGSSATASGAAAAGSVPSAGASQPGGQDGRSRADPGGAAAGSGGGAGSPPPPRARSSGGGIWGAFTHLVAGIAGGALVLFGGEAIAPMTGLTVPGEHQQLGGETARRLAALEKVTASRPAADPELARKLAAAEQQLNKLAGAERLANSLAEKQAATERNVQALTQRVTQQPAGGGVAEERIAKLESTLSSLSEAAKQDPNRGGIPQLAAISGRVADLESTVANQLAALRKNVMQEVDSRLGQSVEASEAARAGTQRIDRALASVKTEQTRAEQRLVELKADDERLSKTVSTMKGSLETVKSDLQNVARPDDLKKALSPVAARVESLEKNVADVVKSEADRRANAERIIMALELGNLKRTVERGAPFAAQLDQVSKIARGKLDLSALERYKTKGVPTTVELLGEFRTLAHAIIAADAQPADGSWSDRLMAGAKSIVKVRRTDADENATGVEAVVARMEKGLKEERLADVATEAGKLSQTARKPAVGWLEKVAARASVDRAIAHIESELKSSLGGTPAAGKKG